MNPAWRRWFSDLHFQDPLQRRQALLLQVILLGLISLIIVAIIINVFILGLAPFSIEALAPILATLASIGISLGLLRRGHLFWSVGIVVGSILIGRTEALLNTGLRGAGETLIIFAIPIAMTGLVIGRRALLLVVVLSIAIVTCIAILQKSNSSLVGSDPLTGDVLSGTVVTFTLIMGLLALLLDQFSLALRQTLAESVRREQLLATRTSELSALNKQLEQEAQERRQVEEALRVSEQQLRNIIDCMFAYVGLIDAAGKVIEANKTAIAASGLSEQEIRGTPLVEVPSIRYSSRISTQFQNAIRQAAHGEVVRFDTEILVADSLLTLDVGFSPLFDADGQVQQIVASGVDITARIKAEEAMRDAQKLESLGVLAGGVAHDFNNLLVAILGQTSLALAHLPASENSPIRTAIEKAVVASRRAADLTRQLLAYSGRGTFEVKPLDLSRLVQENLHLLEVALPKNVELQFDLLPTLPPIEADTGQMQQVVMNLIINAAEAIGEKSGTVNIHTYSQIGNIEAGDDWQQISDPPAAKQYVILETQDDGVGMSRETIAKIFDPFFTTKFTGRGLGLSAVLGIVRGHKGGVWVKSEPGKGTTFRLFFPVSDGLPDEELTMPEPEISQPAGLGKARLVLVIDDEAQIREGIHDILELEGLETIGAPNGEAGIELYRARVNEIGLVLLDLSMPGLSGEATLEGLRAINPEVKVVLSSGYNQSETVQRFAGRGLAGFLQKPYDVQKLLQTVRKYLIE
jgi:PAS domain S-box-containing protein